MQHPSLGARLYGVWFGVFTMIMAACAPTPDVATPSGADQVTLQPTQKDDRDLSLKERIRAVAARSRASRDGHAPRESIRRVYDRMGRVKEESVWRDTMWVARPSTLSSELTAKPLASFLVSPRQVALLTGDSAVAGAASGVVYDSVSQSNKSFADTTLTNLTTGLSIDDRSAADPRLLVEGNTYASNPAFAANGDSITSAVLFSIAPGTQDEVQEISFSSTEMQSVRYFIGQTGANAYYPMALRSSDPRGVVDATWTTRAPARVGHGFDVARMVDHLGAHRGMMRHAAHAASFEKANCMGLLFDMAAYLLAGVICIVGGIFVALFGFETTGGLLVAAGVGLLSMGLYTMIRWGLCKVAGVRRERDPVTVRTAGQTPTWFDGLGVRHHVTLGAIT